MAIDQDFIVRLFEGLPMEGGLVALRQILPAATAKLELNSQAGGGCLELVTLLPDLVRAWRKADGTPVVALQPTFGSNDLSRDLGQAVRAALDATAPGPLAPEAVVTQASSPRLQDLVQPDSTVELVVHDSYDYWTQLDPNDSELAEAAEQSAGKLDPTEQVPGVDLAFWTEQGRPFLRWVLGVDEEALLDALARLQATRQAGVMDGAKYAGAFRALGIVIPVWELPSGTQAADLSDVLPSFRQRFDKALAASGPLDAAARRARAGLGARSLTLPGPKFY
ncbi:MAG: DUF5926 family protein [Micrococcales bacterium]|nr:DUF5926 family protein [Micrococcales bacterium]